MGWMSCGCNKQNQNTKKKYLMLQKRVEDWKLVLVKSCSTWLAMASKSAVESLSILGEIADGRNSVVFATVAEQGRD